MLGAAHGNRNHAILAQVFDQPLGTGQQAAEKAHLRRWPARALVAAYLEYASPGLSRAVLHLTLFEQPG